MAMATAEGTIVGERMTAADLAGGAAGSSVGSSTVGKGTTEPKGKPRNERGREPALTSPSRRAWTPEAPRGHT